MALAENLKVRRLAFGLAQGELARKAGVSQQLITALETGKVVSTRHIREIATVLDCDAADLDTALSHINGDARENTAPCPHDLPIFAAANQIAEMRNHTLSMEAVDYQSRPGSLLRVSGAYGLLIPDDAMAPEFCIGDCAFINPHLPAIDGTTCLFRSSLTAGADMILARLTKLGEREWQIKQWSADQPRAIDRKQFPHCHRIVGRTIRG
jgi:transcriptional regulator with XRE-family HTH domain